MCEVTVVIPNYNGKKYLCSCLEALYENTKLAFRTLVIDNGSGDGSIEEAKERFPQAEYVLLEKNFGFCRAVNIGIKRSSTPYVILLNNDTEIRKGFVEVLLRAVKQNDRIFSVESKMIQYRDQTLIDSAGTFYNALGWAFARGKDKFIVTAAAAGLLRRARGQRSTGERFLMKLVFLTSGILLIWRILISVTVPGCMGISICTSRKLRLFMWEVRRAAPATMSLRQSTLPAIIFN